MTMRIRIMMVRMGVTRKNDDGGFSRRSSMVMSTEDNESLLDEMMIPFFFLFIYLFFGRFHDFFYYFHFIFVDLTNIELETPKSQPCSCQRERKARKPRLEHLNKGKHNKP